MHPAALPLPQPLLLEASLKSGQAFRWRALPGGAFAGVAEGRTWNLQRLDGTLRVACDPDLAPANATAWAGRYFRLDDDYARVSARLSRDEVVADAVRAWPGLRLLRTDPWECLLGFVTSIHDSVGAIETRMARLCRHFGAPLRTALPGFRGWAHATPTPERLARAHESRLRSAAGMGFRARYLRGAARAVVRGDLPLAQLAGMRYEDAHELLVQVPGVGDKVADCVQLYSLGHLESFPVDRWIRRTMEARCFGRPVQPRLIADWARARWGPDAGYAQQFLFHHARLSGASPPGPALRTAQAAARETL